MRVIVAGGTGLIGRALVDNLASDWHEVVVLSREPGKVSGLPAAVSLVAWDGRTAAGWREQAEGADAIVNLAGESIAGGGLFSIFLRHWTPKTKRRILESRINAGRAILEAIQTADIKPHVLIQSSGVDYYGREHIEELSETSQAGEDFLARVAIQWEASTAAVETMGVRRAVIRSAVVLSTAGGVLPLLLLPFRFYVGGRLGTGRQWFPWIHITDEVRAIRFLIDHPNASGPVNLTAPQTLTNADFGRVISKVMRRPSFLPVPASALRLVLGEKATLVLDGLRPVPRRLLDLGFKFQFPDAEAALTDLLK